MATMVRGDRTSSYRLRPATGVLFSLVLFRVYWSWNGWERESILGARQFGRAIFGMMAAYLVMDLTQVVMQVASSIASERDRKSLDALLASRFSSAEIVLGSVAAALFRYSIPVLAAVPVVALLVFLGVVEPALAILTASWLSSMALLSAGISATVSVGSKTSSNAVFAAWGLIGAWLVMPMVYVFVRPHAWPGAPGWLNSAFALMFDGGPVGMWSIVSGLTPRAEGPIAAVGRATGCQGLAGLALLGWSVVRLRPASRSLADAGARGRTGRIKAGLRRAARRRPCGDDPMFWLEIRAGWRVGPFRRIAARAASLAWLAGVGVLAWWLAGPAFRELAERGYGPSPEASSIHYAELGGRSPFEPAPGQARLGYNLFLRLSTLVLTVGTILAIQTWPLESIRADRKRGTWSGLLATPLDRREILRGKVLGALWWGRVGILALVALWTVGLASGALHPLGFLASLASLAALTALSACNGLNLALLDCQKENKGRSAGSPIASVSPRASARGMAIALGFLALLLGTALILLVLSLVLYLVLVMGSLLSYEDVAAALRGGPYPEFGDWPVPRWIGARAVLVVWLVGFAIFAILAVASRRANLRTFDESVGRPVLPRPGPEADRIGALRAASGPR